MRWAICFFLIAFTLSGVPGFSGAQEEAAGEEVEEIVVTATRIETPAEKVGSSISVITSEDLERLGKPMVVEALRYVPGLDIVNNGGPGKTSFVFVRGAKSEHTLVLIDGVEANDPMSPGRTFDFSNLTVENVERIEILRGPQSTLYGSDAMGGVINIITRKGEGRPTPSAFIEYGSFETKRLSLGAAGGDRHKDFALSFSGLDTEGISAASQETGNNERDGYRNKTFSTNLGFEPNEKARLSFVARVIDGEAEIDDFGGAGGDDPNHRQDTKEEYYRGQVEIKPQGSRVENIFGISFASTRREGEDNPDILHPVDVVQSYFRGSILKGDWQANVGTEGGSVFTGGLEGEEERGESFFFSDDGMFPVTSAFPEQVVRTRGFYLQGQLPVAQGLHTTLGGRFDDSDRFGSEVTYRLAAAYFPGGGILGGRGSLGTGFKAPTLFQLFSQFGNLNLAPEESIGWDLGLRAGRPGGRAYAEVTYFGIDFENLIDFVSITIPPFGRFVNVGKVETEGVEFTGGVEVASGLSLKGGYTYLDAKNRETGERLDRRPRNSFSIAALYDFMGKGTVDLFGLYVGKRSDTVFDPVTFSTNKVILGDYFLLNLTASYNISEKFTVRARVENLLDTEYEEISGFGTAGISGYLGLSAGI